LKDIRNKIELFFTGLLQICLVSANTYLISRSVYLAIFFIGFLVALIWSHNVKKIAFGSFWDRFSYSLGAAIGSVLGLYLIKLFIA
jgi:hypothetical protein